MTVREQTENGGILANMERDVQRLLTPVQPGPAFRERLRQVLVAAAGTGVCEVRLRPRPRLRVWVLSASAAALAVFLAQYFLRLLRRSQ
ncbi:MAG: hypothetical protein ACPL7R_08510 [Anaerolineae bacterium]